MLFIHFTNCTAYFQSFLIISLKKKPLFFQLKQSFLENSIETRHVILKKIEMQEDGQLHTNLKKKVHLNLWLRWTIMSWPTKCITFKRTLFYGKTLKFLILTSFRIFCGFTMAMQYRYIASKIEKKLRKHVISTLILYLFLLSYM